MATVQDLFDSPGWQAVNRMGVFANMHNVFQQNCLELHVLLKKIHDDIHLSTETINEIQQHLEQRIFNYFSAVGALTDHTRKMMKFYIGQEIHSKYEKKVDEMFKTDCLSQFVQDMRNYQLHYEIAPLLFSDGKNCWNIIIPTNELLKKNYNWKKEAKKFIASCRDEINLLRVVSDYNHKIDTFYIWVYTELKHYHKNDFKQQYALAKELHIPLYELDYQN